MALPSRDTDPAVERVWLELIRQAPISRRVHLVRSLTATTIALSRDALGAANPLATARDLDLKFVQLNYGDDLARRLAAYLAARDRHVDP